MICSVIALSHYALGGNGLPCSLKDKDFLSLKHLSGKQHELQEEVQLLKKVERLTCVNKWHPSFFLNDFGRWGEKEVTLGFLTTLLYTS